LPRRPARRPRPPACCIAPGQARARSTRTERHQEGFDPRFSLSDSFRATPEPFLPSHEPHPDPVVVDQQISVTIMRDGNRIDLLYVLRHNADIERAIAAPVAEAIELETVAKPHQGGNVLL